jgi:RNA polymerase sigma-70 factor (ECF subfamily)
VAQNDDRPEDEFDLSTPEGCERLVLACQGRLLRFLLGKGVLAEDAKQLCQDAFLTLWQNRHKPRSPQGFPMGIANRLAMAYHRKRGRLPTVSMEDTSVEVRAVPGAEAAQTTDPPADPALPVTIGALLSSLTPRQREVIELVRLQGISRRDAARRLGISEGALRFHEKQALDRLRALRPDQRDGG